MTPETTALPTSAQPGAELAALAPFYRDWLVDRHDRGRRHGARQPGHDRTRACELQARGVGRVVRVRLRAGPAAPRRHVRAHLAAALGDGLGRPLREYRASSADNQGPNLGLYRGLIERDQLIYESARRVRCPESG